MAHVGAHGRAEMAKKPQPRNAASEAESLDTRDRMMAVAADLMPNLGLLTVRQAAELLSISRRTLAELISTREIGVVRIGRAVRFDVMDLRDFIQKRKDRPVGWKSATH